MLRLILLCAMLLGCAARPEAGRSVWVPYSYSAVFSDDGSQTGWVQHEYLLDMGPPPQRELEDGTVEIPLDIEVERRAIPKSLDWVPPDHLEGGPVKVDKDVQVQYLALRLEYVRATEGWLQSSASAMQALADVQAKDKVRGSPDTYLEAFKAYVESEGVSILFHVANLKAEQRGSAAADLIDFQAEMIGELTDLEITSRAADIEPQYR